MNRKCFIQIGDKIYPFQEEDLKFILLEAHWGFRMAQCQHNIKGKRFPRVWKKRMDRINNILEIESWNNHMTSEEKGNE